MTLIEDVARLKELEAHIEPKPWVHDGDDIIVIDSEWQQIVEIPNGEEDAFFIAELRNAAPAMLDVLGEVQSGDSDALAHAIGWIGSTNAHFRIVDCLRRYHAIAKRMEGKL